MFFFRGIKWFLSVVCTLLIIIFIIKGLGWEEKPIVKSVTSGAAYVYEGGKNMIGMGEEKKEDSGIIFTVKSKIAAFWEVVSGAVVVWAKKFIANLVEVAMTLSVVALIFCLFLWRVGFFSRAAKLEHLPL